MTSAYPLPVDELTTRVREHATTLRAWPSCRQVMSEFRVGRPKAAAALDALRATGFDPTADAVQLDTESTPGLDVAPTPARADAAKHAGMSHDAVGEVSRDALHDRPHPPVDRGESARPDAADGRAQVTDAVDALGRPAGRWTSWPLVLIALGAFVSIWGGWVGLGELTGFGPIRVLPGIADDVTVNSAITLPIGVEAYAAFALRIWLAPAAGLTETARAFARWSAIGSLALGAAGQIAYHLMVAAGVTEAPWPITAFVSCLPVVVLGCGAALTHLIYRSREVTR